MNDRLILENQRWQLAFFCVLHLLIFTALFHTIYDIQYSATALFYDYASNMIHGNIPYLDFNIEYPPFSFLFFLLPRLFTASYTSYAILFQAEVVIFNLVALWVIYDIARRLGQAPWKMLTVYTAGILAIGPVIGQQYDIFPAVLTLLAIYFFWLEKHKTAWVFLALGTMTKIFPVVLAPVFIVYYVYDRRYKQLWTALISFAAPCLLVILPFLITSPGSLGELYLYHSLRGIQLESVYSSFLMVVDKMGLIDVYTDFSFGAWNIEGSVEDIFARFSSLFLGAFVLISYSIILFRQKSGQIEISQLGINSFLVVLIVLITSKVLSPQYLIWIIPLLPLIRGRWSMAIWSVFVLTGVLTYYIFPFNYLQLIDLEPNAVAALVLRNLLLMLMAVLAVINMEMPTKLPPGTIPLK